MLQDESISASYLHSSFRLNGLDYNYTTLKEEANRLSSTGVLHEQEVGQFLTAWLNTENHIVVHTSGSTGAPKLIKIQKQYMINSALATGDYFGVQKNTSALLCLSAGYIAGKMMLVRAMILGWHIDIVAPRTNVLDQINKVYDFGAMVPLQLHHALERLHIFKKLIVGGGKVPYSLQLLIKDKPTEVYETYGMTETVSHIAVKRMNPKTENQKETLCFEALPNITLSQDDRNCLIIEAPKLSDQKIITNDIVELKSLKKFVWKGRFDNIINSGGVKLYPEEIETKLQIILKLPFFVTSTPDDRLGHKLILIIESANKNEHQRFQEAVKGLKTLTAYEVPKTIYFLPEFVRTATGKIQRSRTKELLKL